MVGDRYGWLLWVPSWQRMRLEVYPEGDGQPGQDFQQGPGLESTQGTGGKWSREGSLEAAILSRRL